MHATGGKATAAGESCIVRYMLVCKHLVLPVQNRRYPDRAPNNVGCGETSSIHSFYTVAENCLYGRYNPKDASLASSLSATCSPAPPLSA
jgi:hypothetical protein